MGDLRYLEVQRLKKNLKVASARIYVLTQACVGLPVWVVEAYPSTIALHVGAPIKAPVTFCDSWLEFPLSFKGVWYNVTVPYAALLRVEEYGPPPGGGNPPRMEKVA